MSVIPTPFTREQVDQFVLRAEERNEHPIIPVRFPEGSEDWCLVTIHTSDNWMLDVFVVDQWRDESMLRFSFDYQYGELSEVRFDENGDPIDWPFSESERG